jgi:hypothetical protein
MAQEYDMYEYWQQFDENSRWVGFSPSLQRAAPTPTNDEEFICSIDYLVNQFTHENENITVPNSLTEVKNVVFETEETKTEFLDCRNEIDNEDIDEIEDFEVERRLDEVFYKMKETVN